MPERTLSTDFEKSYLDDIKCWENDIVYFADLYKRMCLTKDFDGPKVLEIIKNLEIRKKEAKDYYDERYKNKTLK